MFGYSNVRYKIMLVWLISFTILWAGFYFVMPSKAIALQLDKIEESVREGNWDKANKDMGALKNTYEKSKIFIQMNNSTEIFATFQYTLGQLESTVRHRQEAAIEYIGALKESLNLVIKPFSGH